jgi:glycosyltransferase involved in cell wall biosynthesis
MRILVAANRRGVIGGVETYLQELIPALRCRGHEVGLVFQEPTTDTLAVDGDGTAGPAWEANADTRPAILREIGVWRPDVVYNHGLTDPDLEQALQDAFPTVLFAHGYFGTCVSATKCHGFPKVRACSRVLGPACLALYLPRRCGGLNPLTMFRQYALQRRRHALLKRYGAVFVASQHMLSEYANHGVYPNRLHVVPLFAPGIAADPNPPVERLRTDRILFVGRLINLKGGEFLVRALERAAKYLGKPLTLVVAGSGPEQEKLQNLAHRLGLAAEFHGWVDRSQCVALMRGADLLVVPSLWPEPFGLVGLEAGCVGLPAVAYDVGGIRDWLRPGESGELAPGDPPTVNGLAAALVRALDNPLHRTRLARGAWSVAQQFTLERHCGLLENHLDRVAAAPLLEGRT